jgi:enoyl-CoA hydratase
VGPAAALDILLTGRWLNAAEAMRLKLVGRTLPRQELYIEAERLAAHLASLRPQAVSAAKEAVTRGLDLSLAQGLRLERALGLSIT